MLPFWIALQFLSSLPVRLPGMPRPEELGRSLLFYPLAVSYTHLTLPTKA